MVVEGLSSWPDSAGSDVSEFVEDPLFWLLRASRRGSVVVISRSGSVLFPAEPATGTVAVFGPDAVRQVLTDIETFGMPVSVSTRYKLPPVLANLNSALFSMTGSHHRSRQQLLARALGPDFIAEYEAAVDQGIRAFFRNRPLGDEISLMEEMRRLAQCVAERVLLGADGGVDAIGPAVQLYFNQRRRYASRGVAHDREDLDTLIESGTRVDVLLRERVRALRRQTPSGEGHGILGYLCRYGDEGNLALTEDELVAHANILFMSSSEPIATAMTWILLGLSQRLDLRSAIREEPRPHRETVPGLLRGIVLEVLRLVPPSAIMVRLTRREVRIAGSILPPLCEVIVSPFAEHRRPEVFPDPHRLLPGRWGKVRPDSFQFFPFGGGARYCLGRRIALATVERATRAVLMAADPVLAWPQRLDWRMNVTLLPSPDPVLRLVPHGHMPVRGVEFSGPAATLLQTAKAS